jgi:mono/diheme cytochrome c family protein
MRYITLLLTSLVVVLVGAVMGAGSYPSYNGYYKNNYEPVIVAIPVAPDYYYSVGDGDAEERIADKVVKKLGDKVAQAQPQPGDADRDEFRLSGARLRSDDKVLALFDTNCIRCHKPGVGSARMPQLMTADRKLFVDPDQKKERARRERVYDSVESGEMPKNQPALPASVKQLLRDWADKVK